jgi:hypothetical protein
MGATIAFVDPERAAVLVGEDHPPLWQYLLCLLARRVHGCPQRARIMDPWQFFPANQPFLEGKQWGHDVLRGPLRGRTPRVRDFGSRRRVVGDAMPPLWQYFPLSVG